MKTNDISALIPVSAIFRTQGNSSSSI